MIRALVLILLSLLASLVLFAAPASAARQFPETGYTVANNKILDYFDSRGGARVLGYPISHEFTFLGSQVQLFQRAVLQVRPNGDVGLLNILDEGVLPYTRINGSTFPGPDTTLMTWAPAPSDPSYAAKALEFVRNNAPDLWEGVNVNFYSTFASTVAYEEAFPRGDGEPGLLPLINLEIWGLPISRPGYDPNNGNFLYMRFQRGIMHFDRSTGRTQGILIGEYLKALITGQNLPPDLDQEARGSRLYRQYTNAAANGLARPADLPGTSMYGAFEKDGVLIPLQQPMAAAPAAAPPSPAAAAPARPASIVVQGPPWFIQQTELAMSILNERSPLYYSYVKQWVYRIEESPSPSYDPATRTLRVNEPSAFPPEWGFDRDRQLDWYAGLLVHNATHIEQALNGRPTTGQEAEQEARRRQREALDGLDNTKDPPKQFYNYVDDAINGMEATFGDWEQPRSPGSGPRRSTFGNKPLE